MATVEIMVIVTFSLLILVTIANLIAVQFGRGTLRAAVDEAARVGARLSDDPIATCERRQAELLSGLGKVARNVNGQCEIVDGVVTARASATFTGWIIPDITQEASAGSVQELAPPPPPPPPAENPNPANDAVQLQVNAP